ncbi:uncharacterized protein DEA37_0006862, partial [Paragonimus westermani]
MDTLDFGFARRAKDAVQRNELRGTLLYMAPEIYCEGLYHPSCDLWSVGVILYECLFGSPPYASQDSESLKLKLLKDEPIEQAALASTLSSLELDVCCVSETRVYDSSTVIHLSSPLDSCRSKRFCLRVSGDAEAESHGRAGLPSDVTISSNCASLIRRLLKRHPTERMSHEEFFEHPFVDLEHAPSADSLDKAVSIL